MTTTVFEVPAELLAWLSPLASIPVMVMVYCPGGVPTLPRCLYETQPGVTIRIASKKPVNQNPNQRRCDPRGENLMLMKANAGTDNQIA